MSLAEHPLLLASGSPRRAELLRAAGIPFEVGAIGAVDETVEPGLGASKTVELLAERKARAAVARHPDRVLLTADTLVFLDGSALGKPVDEADAVRMLQALSGATHEVATGVAVAGPGPTGPFLVDSALTRVSFRALSDEEIRAYVAGGEPMDKAGAYAIQGGARGFVDALDGERDTVIGLPVALIRQILARSGR